MSARPEREHLQDALAAIAEGMDIPETGGLVAVVAVAIFAAEGASKALVTSTHLVRDPEFKCIHIESGEDHAPAVIMTAAAQALEGRAAVVRAAFGAADMNIETVTCGGPDDRRTH